MYPADDKARQMARSILPSRNRKGARVDLAKVKRKNRRTVTQRLNDLRYFDYDDFDAPIDCYPNAEIRNVVRDRRAADKLSHYQRWAVQITKHLDDPQDRLGYMKALLPTGLIGDHALSHLKFMNEFGVEQWMFYRSDSYYLTAAERRERGQRNYNEKFNLWVRKVTQALDEGKHKAIHQAIKRSHRHGHARNYRGDDGKYYIERQPCHQCGSLRYLRGRHDIEDFITDIFRTRHEEWRNAVWEVIG